MSLVPTADFVTALSSLDYHERIKKAHEFGRDHAKDAELSGWIQELRKHPDPVVPQIPEEKGFTEILPPQKLNIAKFYDRDQYAISAAIASQTQTDLLVAELSSPSRWFQTKAAKAVARQVKDDELLEKQCLSATKAVRKKLLHALIREKKVQLLEKLYPSLYTQKGPEFAIDILHGCSGPFIKECFKKDELLINSPHVDWKKMGQFHGPLLMEMLEDDLKVVHFIRRYHVWSKWSPKFFDSFFFKAHHGKALWNLWAKYPSWKHRHLDIYDVEENIKEADMIISDYALDYPAVINERPRHFLKVASKEIFEFFRYSSGYDEKRETFAINAPIRVFFNGPHVANYLPQLLDLYRWWHNISAPRFVRDCLMLGEASTIFPQLANPHDVLSFAKLGFELYKGTLTKKRVTSYFTAFVRYVYNQMNAINQKNNSRLSTALKFTGDQEQIKLLQNRRAQFCIVHQQLVGITINEYSACWLAKEKKDYHESLEGIIHVVVPQFSNFPVTSAGVLLDGIKHWTDQREKALVNRKDAWIYNFDRTFASVGQKLFGVTCIAHRGRRHLDGFFSEKELETAVEIEKRLIEIFYSYWATDPVTQASCLCYVFHAVDQAQADDLYKCFKEDHAIHILVGDKPYWLVEKIWPLLTHTVYQDHLKAALASDKVSDRIKEDLQCFRDVTDHAVRKELEKATDSNSEPQRKAAMKNLVEATFRTRETVQLKRTLAFMRNKLKNEQITMRIAGIKELMRDNNRIDPLSGEKWQSRVDREPKQHFPDGITEEMLDIYLAMLQDALEVRDLDLTPKDNEGEGGGLKLPSDQLVTANHPLLRYFLNLSHHALWVGASNPTGPIFNFGVEIQWRIQLHRSGPKNISKQFSISLPTAFDYGHTSADITHLFLSKDKDGVFAAVVDQMESRVGAKNKEWRESYDWQPLFWIINHDWDRCPSVVAFLSSQLSLAKTKRDHTGVCLAEGNSVLCRVFEFILNLEKKKAYKKELVKEYFELMLNSYQGKSVVFQWLKAREDGLKGKAQKIQRDKSVKELLSISKSAIHLKFVWRHLLSWSQTHLTPFLNPSDPFRGIFYVEPGARKLREEKKPAAPAKAAKPSRKRKVVVEAPPKLKELKGTPKDAVTNIKDLLKKATKAEKRMRKDLEEAKHDDHEDYFHLPACYGLHKLLPAQADLLAKKWVRIANNSERDTPFRTEACRRFTLVPTVNYADIVFYAEANPKFAVNLLEALMQGTIYNDEPLAPLNYLLSPQFLSSDRARVAAYAVCAAVKYLKSVGITDIISLVLSGKRREGLKVTAYKEMIRLLASMPTSKHISMIQTEWRRKELHRDVRIAIVKAAYLFLYKNTEKGIKVAWEILLDAVSLKRQEEWKYSHELIIALLGATPDIPKDTHEMAENLFLKPLLFEFFNSTTKCKIPLDHCERFAQEVVLPLCTTALVDDVKTIALFSLVLYKTLGTIAEDASALYYQLMADEKNNLLSSTKPADQGVFDARWRHAGLHMLKVTATNGTWVPSGHKANKKASRDVVTKILRTTVDRINAYKIDDRRKRIHMVGNLRHFINLLPAQGPYSLWDWDQEKEFMEPLKDIPFLWEYRAARTTQQLGDKWSYPPEDFDSLVRSHVHDMFLYASTRPDIGTKVVEHVDTLFAKRPSCYDNNVDRRWVSLVLPLLEEDGYWPDEGKPSKAYNAIRIRAALHALKWASYSLLHSHGEALITFFDSCLAEASKGTIPDLTKSLGTLFLDIVRAQVDKSCAGTWDQPRVLCNRCKKFVNHITTYLSPPADGNITPLVVAVDYSTRLLSSQPLLLGVATNRVGAILHWLLHEQTGVASSDTLQSKIVTLLERIEANSRPNYRDYSCIRGSQPITPVLDIITHLLDQQLDQLPSLPDNPEGPSLAIGEKEPEPNYNMNNAKQKSLAYSRLSTEIGLHVLKAYPQFVLWRPKCFWRFVDSIIEADRKETVSTPLRFKTVSDIVCSGYYQRLCRQKKQKADIDVYSTGLLQAKQLATQASTSSHPIFYRSVACHLSIFLGYLSTLRDQTDLTYSWRPEFVEILNVWCEDAEGSIRKIAWEVDTSNPVTVTEYSSLAVDAPVNNSWR